LKEIWPMSITPNTRIGRYEIRAAIGKGGMGEVFLAHDTLLERSVAIKFLTKEFCSDAERLRRFIREAKSASALNHPNIITIYDVGEEEGRHFFAGEFIDGTTLRDHLRKNKLSIYSILNIARQIAEALAAAHSAGIIHRDIKPENIMIRNDGYVKVLDFGLAKLKEPESAASGIANEAPTRAFIKTEPGVVMGTATYMSPEQARGLDVDERTDIWSLGVVIYEMLARRVPFDGKTTSDVIAAILTAEPPALLNFRPELSNEVVALVENSLRKDSDKRYRSVRELLLDIEAAIEMLERPDGSSRKLSKLRDSDKFTEDTDSGPVNTVSQTDNTQLIPRENKSTVSEILFTEAKKHPRGIAVSLAIFLVIAGAFGFGLYRLVKQAQLAETFQSMRMTKLTFNGNVADDSPAISPDGKYVAYVVKELGRESLMLRHISTSSNVQVLPPSEITFDGGVSFSPDGAHIYYCLHEKSAVAAMYRVAVLGGAPQKILDDAEGPVRFSSDGKQMAFLRNTRSLMIADSDGGNARELKTLENGEYWKEPSWSDDGRKIVAGFYSLKEARELLGLVEVANGNLSTLAKQPWRIISGLGWKGKTNEVLLSGRDQETGLSQIWTVDLSDGSARRITNDLNSYYGVTLSSDAKSFVSVQGDRLSNLWLASAGEKIAPKKITLDAGKDDGLSGIVTAPDGSIIYTTRIAGIIDIWRIKPDGSGAQQLTRNSKDNHSPCVSSDGNFIVFVSDRNGNPSLWRMRIDGSEQTQLTTGNKLAFYPSCSETGNWVAFQFGDNEHYTIWKIPVEGGEATPVTKVESGNPVISPDGKFIAFRYGPTKSDAIEKLALISSEANEAPKILNLPAVLSSRLFRWSKDGRDLVYISVHDQVDDLWAQPIEGGAPKRLTEFSSDKIFRFDISRDGNSFVLARGHDGMDVVLISNFD